MHTVFLLLGSNLGNRLQHFADADLFLEQQIGAITKSSSIYETAPWGFTEQPEFLNKVIEVKTKLTPQEVLQKILTIEIKLGRARNEKWHERIIDIDILFYDDLIIHEDNLKIPHPHLHERRFTLEPLNEIAHQLIHPLLKKNIAELIFECADNSSVEKFTQ
ncbi:MAG: 2-amino-4-hydroxy-6-hydroxymethyldihydropteridine diphosphokinase [Bacteroidia bacterium]